MGKILSKVSKLGVILITIQLILSISLPLWVGLLPNSCNDFICIFTPYQAYFFLFNLPGLFISGIPFIFDFLHSIQPVSVQMKGDLYYTDYLFMFITSSVVYYLLGMVIGKFLSNGRVKTANYTGKK